MFEENSGPVTSRSASLATSDGSISSVQRAEVRGKDINDLDCLLWDVLMATATSFPERDAVVSMWQSDDAGDAGQHPASSSHWPRETAKYLRWSYARLLGKTLDTAQWLENLGCGPGMTLLACLWNSAEWSLFVWTTAKLRMIIVPIDPRAIDDLPSLIARLDAQVLIVQDDLLAQRIEGIPFVMPASLIRIQCSGSRGNGWLAIGSNSRSDTKSPRVNTDARGQSFPTKSTLAKESIAMMILTSGTTGESKICPHTNRNIMSQTYEYDHKAEDPMERWLVHTPVSHVFAINNTLRAWKKGGTVVFPAKSFEVEATLNALADEKCTIMSATPTLIKSLMLQAKLDAPKRLHLDLVTMGGTTIAHDDARLCREGLGANHAIQAYGMTEGAPLISWRRHDALLKDGYHPGVGRVLPGAAVRVCRPGSREVLSIGDIGELHVGGTSVISAYYSGSEHDNSAFYEDYGFKWFMTGDQGSIDEEGIVHLLGRYKDIIIRGGENIYPGRIESILAEIPGLETCIIGIPDALAGQIPVAVVNLPTGIDKTIITNKTLTLGPNFGLGGVYTLDELNLDCFPTTSLGKVRKGALFNAVAKHRQLLYGSTTNEVSNDAYEALVTSLVDTWESLTAARPHRYQDISCFADSIGMLRFCDAVVRLTGKQIYLQDLVDCNTVEKQAKLLANRNNNPMLLSTKLIPENFPKTLMEKERTRNIAESGTVLSSVHIQPSVKTKSSRPCWEETAQQTFANLQLRNVELEEIIPIRDSLRRFAVGQRPQSYHVAFSFRVPGIHCSQLHSAIGQLVSHHRLLRAVLCQSPSDSRIFHAVPSYSEDILSNIVINQEVETTKQAIDCAGKLSAASFPEPFMLRAVITRCKEDGLQYLALKLSHSIMDAMCVVPWCRHLDLLLQNPSAKLPVMVPHSLFADLYENLSESREAKEAIKFHVQRLRGISLLKRAFWPAQRAPGWMISDDSASPHAVARDQVRQVLWGGKWKHAQAQYEMPRNSRIVHLSELPLLVERLNVTPPSFAKAAITLLNVLQTKSSHAVYTSWESSRSWPFLPKWIEDRLPPSMSIDGPTVEWVLNMTEVDQGERVCDFVQRVEQEQQQITKHEHASWSQIAHDLQEEGEIATEASFRQAFVWDVSLLGMAVPRGYLTDFKILEPVNRHNWADCGLFWNAFLIDPRNLYFIASWDTAQMNDQEVQGYCDKLAEIMRRLSMKSNWDKRISEMISVGAV